MNTSDLPVPQMPASRWQLLGDLELPVGTHPEETVLTWLSELLVPLALHRDFVHRILQSAQNSAGHVLQSKDDHPNGHIHLVIHIPMDHDVNSGTWGFFHVEKSGHGTEETSALVHSIEFYLYKESYGEIA
jgi:hypothetical protein